MGNQEEHDGDQFDQFSKWLWQYPVGNHEGVEDDETETGVEEYEEDLGQEGVATAKLSSLTRTLSRITPPGQSSSGRVFQRASHFQAVYSKPTMSIKSQWSTYASSVNPLPQQKAPSLMSWIPIVSSKVSNPRLESSPSPKAGRPRSGLRRLTG
ncbi:P4 [Pepper whitefly borne vein yellow virus]|uniref:P4 n=1 Tax=Pepper whitefly borne vein yellow virus TaxID=2575429 RepID=A0A4D6V178_9VIRU|nr:P4 [Pepper whitefly borne vein yellow virus]